MGTDRKTRAADRDGARRTGDRRAPRTTLGEMVVHAPSSDFRARVLAALHAPESRWGRTWRRLSGAPEPAANVFAAFLDGELTGRRAEALAAFVEADPEAAVALDGWRRLFDELESLPALAPAEALAERVMARVEAPERERVPQPKAVPAGASPAAGVPRPRLAARGWALVTAWIDARWPTPRDRFAVTSGMAVGPVAAFLVTLHMLSGNSLLTTFNVASFLRARIGTAVERMTEAVSANPVAEAAMGRISGLWDSWAPSSPALATGLIGFGGLTLLSTWILYRNVLNVSRNGDRRVRSR